MRTGGTTHFDTGTYTYDSAGNILGQSHATYGGTYTYDSLSRILSATYGGPSKTFTYDRWGNLLSNSPLTFQMDGTLDNNHIKVGGSTATAAYDSRGNLTNWNNDWMHFDSADRLYRVDAGAIGPAHCDNPGS